ncbi:hypothetical protein [Exiguobacterium sp.]|nr:hypothetical protein [Exiguobacterium sp.]
MDHAPNIDERRLDHFADAFPLAEVKTPVDQEPVELDQQQQQPTETE